jgi:hypothetical protein
MPMRPIIALVSGLVFGPCSIAVSAPAASADCSTEATALVHDQAELPRLDVVSPADRPILCITLETVMSFAGRLKSHVAHCPNSDLAAAAAEWEKTRADYSRRFNQRRCRKTLPP